MAEVAAASDQQLSVWLLQLHSDEQPVFNIGVRGILTGGLEVELLRAAVDDLVARHEVLRTTFRLSGGRLWQQVVEPAGGLVPATPGTPADVEGAIVAECRRPFALDRDLPVRAHLYRLAADRHLLLFVFHHIAVDAYSLGILLSELPQLYAARVARRPPALDPPVPYRDYSNWQQTSGIPERAMEYWLRRLAGARPSELPATAPDPDAGPGTLLCRPFPTGLYERCSAYAVRCRASTFMVLAAGFAAALAASTGRRDLLFGTNAANRQHWSVPVGPLITTLPVRLDIPAGCDFARLVRLTRETLLNGHEHEEIPFARLTSRLRREGALPPGPVPLPVMFHSAPALPPDRDAGQPRWQWRGAGVDPNASAAGVSVLVGPRDGHLVTVAQYDRERYRRAEVDRLLDRWLAVLAAGLDDPEARLPVNHSPEGASDDRQRRAVPGRTERRGTVFDLA